MLGAMVCALGMMTACKSDNKNNENNDNMKQELTLTQEWDKKFPKSDKVEHQKVYIYLLKENFAQIPDELYLAAKVDGTRDIVYLWRVMLPISKPTVITIIILKIIECWNAYVWPRLITDNEKYFLVSNGIQAIRESGFGRDNVPAMMAAVVSVSLPLIILFLVFRKKIMAGVARGGTKG